MIRLIKNKISKSQSKGGFIDLLLSQKLNTKLPLGMHVCEREGEKKRAIELF